MNEPTVKFTLRVPESIAEGMTKVAKLTDRSVNGAIINACRKVLDEFFPGINNEESK